VPGRTAARESAPEIAINARAAIRGEIGGVERLAREMATRLPALRPDRYRVIRPPAGLAHRAGHAWEQAVLPAQAARCAALYSPANLAPLLYRRNVVVIHDAAALRHPEAYSRLYVDYQRRLLPLLVRGARMLITVSEFSRGELIEVLGAAPGRVKVIPEGVGERFLAAAGSAAGPGSAAPVPGSASGPGSSSGRGPGTVAKRYGLFDPYVLVVGTISARKNPGALEPVAAALRERGIELLLAGSDRGYLRGSGAGLRRLGYIEDEHLPALYQGARALAMPSTYEGFGLPCLEAMACGTPVVAANRGALPETCGAAALLVDPGDASAFAEAVVAAACDQAVRDRLVDAGRRRAASFPWSRTAALTDAALGELLERA
jgi:glycosyltransferase involved in cell wall biosynthesis